MLAAVPPEDLHASSSVLEIGGGVGAVQAELLLRGAGTGEVVEVVGAYEPFAQRLAQSRGLGTRTTFRVLDLLGRPDEVAAADVVVLNRVVCCSEDGVELTAAAAALTRGTLLISFPRHSGFAALLQRIQHRVFRLLGRRYRFFVRPASVLIGAATAQGLSVRSRGRDGIWEYVALGREGG